eukprot:TRINITY_DN66371_c12_g1_i2.p1 TRINITY_DN66371_c12_g1~~TRINITY_DN66371_c12_g1_i2.p1  ORF type:complete len:1268 (-),score=738.58 TRINITY_DN66371_c12_g1_i2:648-4451(-)
MQASTLRLLLLLLAVSACVSLSLGAVSQSRRSVDAISAQPDTIGSSLTREFKHMARKFRAQRRSALQQQQYERQVERLLHARSLKSALRDSLMNSQIDPPTGSSQSAKNFLASLPRYDAAGQPAPKELSGKDLYGIAVGPDEEEFPKVYTDAFETEEREDSPNKVERERLNKKAQNYAVGVASTAAISLVLMIMSCVSCLCFCLGRCCCNTCGERHPTQLYNKKQVFWSRLLVVLFAAVMFALFMVGYTANIGASQGIDKSYGAGDKLVEWSVDIVTVVNSSRSILDDVRSLIKDTDSLVFGVLPNNSRVDEWISCTNDTVFGVLDVKDDLLSFMRGLNTTIAGLSNFTVLKTAVDDVILAIDALPNLNKLDSDVKAVNESLSAVPNVDPTIQQLNKTNATINSLSALPTLASGLKTLDQAAVNFSDPANNMKSLITQYENAVPSDNLINDMHRSIKKPSTTTKQYMLANITAFNNSLNAMPKVADFRATVTSLNNTINSVRSSLTLFDDVSSLQTKLNDKPDFAAMRVTIREMQTFVDGGFQNITSLRASLVKINVSLNLLPKFGPLIQTINDTIGDVNDVKNTNLSKVIANLDKLNSTFNDIKCILDVFNVVRDINSTLVELPKNVTKDVTDAEKTITDVLNNATQYRTDIEDGRNKTVDVQNALDDIPNLNDTLDNVQDVNKSVSDLPDMNKVFTQIDDMNKTLADIPELGQYLREIDNFNSSMDIGSLSDMTQTMKDINRTLNDVPELSKYLTNFENASDTISSLQPKLTQAKQVIEAAPDGQLNDNVFTAAGQGSTQTQMVALIEQLNTTIQTRENSSELISTLTKVNNTINNRPNVTKLSADIDDLESTRKQFPNIDNLMTELQDVKGVRSNTGDLDELIKGTLLKDLNKTVTDLQNTDLQETSRTLGDMQDNVDKLDLANIISSLDFEDNFEREDILDNIESIKDVVNSTTVDDMLENIDDAEEPIAALPEQSRFGVNKLVAFLEPLVAKGLAAVLIFGVVSDAKVKDACGTCATDENGPVAKALRALRKSFPKLLLVTDVCLCGYTDHGHCGVLREDPQDASNRVIDNAPSIKRIAEIAVFHAKQGAHVVAPSDMMDGRIGAIKAGLRAAGFGSSVSVMSYAAKFASCYYGPFRDAASSGAKFGDRSLYQLPPGSRSLALRALKRDVEEGADMVMVKPGGPYLDIVRDARNLVDDSLPVAVYQVSGEYAMIWHAAKAGALDLRSAIMESLLGMRRAGADILITYYAPRVLDYLSSSENE